MKGPFSFWTFFGITIWIDLITLLFFVLTPKRKTLQPFISERKPIFAMIPVHRELPSDLKNTIVSLYREKYPLKAVIVCADAETQGIRELVEKLSEKLPNLIYVESPENSKAKKINFVAKKFGNSLGDFLYVRDCKVVGEAKCIERMMLKFTEDEFAAVTSHGYLLKPENFLARSYYYGKEWVNGLGKIRKRAQEIRKAVFVVCGASTIYRTEILRKFPIYSNTKTEDTHYTWALQFRGYKIGVANKAQVYAPDLDGRGLNGIKNQLKQSYRWSSGTIQCLYVERKNFTKSKKLFFTTIFPGFLEAVTYSFVLTLLPFLLWYYPLFGIGFLLGDTFFSLLGTLILMPRKFIHTVVHYPQIFFFKYLNAAVFITAFIRVTAERIMGKTHKWSNEWTPVNYVQKEKTKIKTLLYVKEKPLEEEKIIEIKSK